MEDYYDIDSILSEDQNVKCFFQSDVSDLSWLDGGHEDTLRANSKFDIPFWLAREILTESMDTVPLNMETPTFFAPKIKNALRANAAFVDLPKLCPNFFRFGLHYLERIDDSDLAAVLENAFKSRLTLTMDHTQSGGNHHSAEYLDRLDDTEKDLYKAGLESSASVAQWNQQSFGRIRSADEILLKRKIGS